MGAKETIQNWNDIFLPVKDIFFLRPTAEGGFISIIVIGDKTRVHCHESVTKSEQGMASSLLTETEEVSQATTWREGYADFLLRWMWRSVILEHYMSVKNIVTSAMYTDLPRNHLRPAVKSKLRGLLRSGVLLQQRKCSTPFGPCNGRSDRGAPISLSTTLPS